MFKIPAIATVAALAAIVATPAAARDHAWAVGNDSIHLYYTDLDMNSAAGRAELLARVTRAADKLCRDRVDRDDCVARTVEETSHMARASALRVAMAERSSVQLATR